MDEIKVLDRNSELIHEINQLIHLKQAKEQWDALELIPLECLPNTNWTHSFTVKSGIKTAIWLYNQEGYVALLSKQLKPIYKVKDVEQFNKVYLSSG